MDPFAPGSPRGNIGKKLVQFYLAAGLRIVPLNEYVLVSRPWKLWKHHRTCLGNARGLYPGLSSFFLLFLLTSDFLASEMVP